MKTLHLVDPAVRAFAPSLKAFDPEHDRLDSLRAQIVASYAQLAPSMPEAREVHHIPGRVLVYRPRAQPTRAPAIVYVHGGGFISGVADMNDALCVELAQKHQAVVVSIDYRLAPETPFPGPVEDCFAALRWVLREADSLGVDATRVVLMGHSAGGGLAAATAQLHRDREGDPLAGQVLIYPMLDARTGTPDAPHDNATTGEFVWTREVNRFAWKSMRGATEIPAERLGHFSPALAVKVEALPPTFLAVGSLDLFVDEGVDYALRLSRAGVSTELHVYAGGVHGFDLFPGDTSERLKREVDGALSRFLSAR